MIDLEKAQTEAVKIFDDRDYPFTHKSLRKGFLEGVKWVLENMDNDDIKPKRRFVVGKLK